jgi:hypothetical protein
MIKFIKNLFKRHKQLNISVVSDSFTVKDLERAWTAGRAHYCNDLTFEKWLKNYH